MDTYEICGGPHVICGNTRWSLKLNTILRQLHNIITTAVNLKLHSTVISSLVMYVFILFMLTYPVKQSTQETANKKLFHTTNIIILPKTTGTTALTGASRR
jgi:hypothetical protein